MSPLPVFAVPEAMTRRLAAVVLLSQAPVLVFGAVGARALADAAQRQDAAVVLLAGSGLAGLAVLAAALLRSPVGIALGWAVQIACLLATPVVPAMGIIGVVFTALWVTALRQGRKMDALTRARAAGGDSAAASRQAAPGTEPGHRAPTRPDRH